MNPLRKPRQDRPFQTMKTYITATYELVTLNVSNIFSKGSVTGKCVEECDAPTEKPKRLRKFISKSHNSLVSRPADYSKVESKVKQYIVTMKEQQEHRRRGQTTPPLSRKFHPTEASVHTDGSSLIEPTENIEDLKRQLADQAAKVEVLQEDHDRLFLQNARLLNTIDELRFKFYGGQHSNQSERRTNSPSEFGASGVNQNKNSIDSAISLRTNIEQESLFGSNTFRSTTLSVYDESKQFSSSFKAANRSLTEVEAIYKR